MSDETNIDTTNRFMIAARANKLVIMAPVHPFHELTEPAALSLIAWLIVMGESVYPEHFMERVSDMIEAVQST